MAERVDPTAAAPALRRETAPDRWDKTLAAFLAEKLRRSGSHRTVETYAGILRSCFGRLGTTPDAVTPADVLGFAQGIGASGRIPSAHEPSGRQQAPIWKQTTELQSVPPPCQMPSTIPQSLWLSSRHPPVEGMQQAPLD